MRALRLSLILVVCAACGDPSASREPAATAVAPPSRPGRAHVIRVELPGVRDLSDIPRLMAIEALEKHGYVVETSEYRDNPIALQALVDGQLDFASLPFPQTLAAIQQGAAIAAIIEGGVLSRTLIVAPDIMTCADLDGREVSTPNLVSAQVLSVRRFFAIRCPQAKIDLVVIAGVENRLAAFLTRRTAGAILDATSQLKLERTPDAPFNVLAVLGIEFPGVSGSTIVASRTFVRTYPETARDVVRELLLAIRRIQDPATLSREMQARLGLGRDEADAAARLSLQQQMWSVNGGLSDAVVQANIDFSVEAGVIQPGLAPSAVVDGSFIEAALEEVGWQ